MDIQFKFRDDAPAEQRSGVVRRVEQTPGPATVRPLFPGDPEPELAALYRIEDIAGDRAQQLLDLLNGSPHVEFAEPDAPRKLIR